MKAAGLLLVLACTSAAAAAPVVEKDVCPGPCCHFRDWQTEHAFTLVDRFGGHRRVAHVARGATVHVLTANVVHRSSAEDDWYWWVKLRTAGGKTGWVRDRLPSLFYDPACE